MAEQNGQAQDAANSRWERAFGVVALLTGILLIAAIVPLSIRTDQKRAQLFDSFQQETGVTVANLITASPDYLYVWWEEWRISNDARQKMRAYVESGNSGRTYGTPDIPDPSAYTAFMAAHGIYETGEGLYWRQLESSVAAKTTEPPPWALAGYLPPFAREQIPPTGRLNSEKAVAEYRLVVDWQGQPISPDVLADAALPLQGHLRSFFQPTYVAKIKAARTLHEIKDYIDSWTFLPFDPVLRNLADSMKEGRIPAPQPVTESVHAELRRANPGVRNSLDYLLVLCGQNHAALDKYAKSHNATPLDAYNILRAEYEASQEASRENPFAHYLFLGYPKAWAHWLFGIGGVFMFFASRGWLDKALSAMVKPSPADHDAADATVDGVVDVPASEGIPHPLSSRRTSAATRDPRSHAMNPTDPRDIRASLAERGPVGRTMHHRKELDVSQKTKQQIEAETGIFEAQSEQFLTIRRKEAELYKLQNEIADHQDEGEMRDLKRQKRAAELEAEIIRLKDEQDVIRHNQEKRRKELEPKDSPKPSSTLSPKDKARKSWYAKRAQGMALSDVRDDEERRIREQFKDNPEALRAYLDLLQNWYEEELQK